MAEEKKKETVVLREIENVEALETIPQNVRVTTYITDRKNERKFAIYAQRPTTDEEAQARFKCDMSTLIEKGIIQLMYGIGATAIKAELEGSDETVISTNLQKMADEKTAESTRKAGIAKVTKQESTQYQKIMVRSKEAGYDTPEEYIAALVGNQKKTR